MELKAIIPDVDHLELPLGGTDEAVAEELGVRWLGDSSGCGLCLGSLVPDTVILVILGSRINGHDRWTQPMIPCVLTYGRFRSHVRCRCPFQ